MLARTLFHGNSAKFWKTMPRSGPGSVTARPSTRMAPLSASSFRTSSATNPKPGGVEPLSATMRRGMPRAAALKVLGSAVGLATSLAVRAKAALSRKLRAICSNRACFHPATGKSALQPRSLGQLAISGLVFIALVPLAEEIYFRGLLLDWLQQKLSPLLSAALTAAVFSLMHFQFLLRPGFPGWLATAAIAALGVLTALWVQRTHSLRAPVAAHAAYNLTVMLVLFFVR